MNRFLFFALPSVSQASEIDGVHLLQKHSAKASVAAVPAENVPPMAGYDQQEGVGFGVGRCQISNSIGATSFEDCKRECDQTADCGGWSTTVFDLGGMPGPGGMMMPVNHNCYYFCTTSPKKDDARMYSYIKQATTISTTTSSTLYTTTEPKEYDCGSGGWTEKSIKWCCANRASFFEKEKYCPDAVVASAVDDPHIESVHGEKFDVYEPGAHEFVVLPAGAAPEDADLHISGKVRKFGTRENDLWIRKLTVQGNWVAGGPYQFKTSSVPFGNKRSALVKMGGAGWKAMKKADLDTGFLVSSEEDDVAPAAEFAQSVSRKVAVMAGPVTVHVDFATSQKNGEHINHLDLHLEGLEQADAESMGGLLSGDVSALQFEK